MKKYIILLFFIIWNSYLYAEAPDTTSADFKHIIYKDVKDVVKSLAETLKVGTEHVYGVLVKQQLVNSITNLCIMIFLLVITLVVGNTFFTNYKYTTQKDHAWYKDTIDDHSVLLIGFVGFIILLIALVIFVTATTSNTIMGFVNPEYGAIQTIVELLK